MIYLDHNATTPLHEAVLSTMLPFLGPEYGNPSSLHRLGRYSRSAIETAREQVAALVNAHPSQVIFTSGGTEANNLALKGGLHSLDVHRLAVSAVEHESVLATAQQINKTSCQLSYIPVEKSGLVDFSLYQACLRQLSPNLVSIMLANNETGVLQDIKALRTLAESSVFHTDAVQALGKIPVDFVELGVDLMSLSAHKIAGPKGCGALIVNKSLKLNAIIDGGGQEQGLRGGTENVAAIVGFGKAAELTKQNLDNRTQELKILLDYLEQNLVKLSGIELVAANTPRLPNTLMFTVAGMEGETLLLALDQAGIAVGSGSACASHKQRASHVLQAMGMTELQAQSAIRISLGPENSRADIDQLISSLRQQLQFKASMGALLNAK
ncbi:MAG: cysteine desulfurase [Gammaproteobacteria bacterium]|nr:cysteine desulfurase [Gammaproteobacteria bacterium]MDH5731264.1 cysteine desulfurase [Gammaproteobacteria bacterium]